MSSPRPARPAIAIGETLARVTDLLDDVGGTVDRDRRRAAARLSELVRSADDDLGRFAERHLPGRHVDDEALKEARELAVELATVVGLIGEAPGATAALRDLREVVSRRREALEHGEAPPADVSPRPPSAPPSAPPPMIPAPTAAASLPTFMQSPPATGFPGFTAPAAPAVVPPPTYAPQGGPIAPPPRVGMAGPADAPPPPRPTPVPAASPAAPAPLPFSPPAAPAPGAGDPSTRPGAPTTGLPFTRDPQRRG